MALSDSAAREIAKVLRKHVSQQALARVIDELLELPDALPPEPLGVPQ